MKSKILSREKIAATQLPKENLVDKAFALDTELKEKAKELKELKEQIKAQAEMQQTHEVHGLYATAVVSDTQSWNVDAEELLKWLKKNKKTDLLPILLKPAVSELSKYVGEISLREFAELETKEYSKLVFKPRK